MGWTVGQVRIKRDAWSGGCCVLGVTRTRVRAMPHIRCVCVLQLVSLYRSCPLSSLRHSFGSIVPRAAADAQVDAQLLTLADALVQDTHAAASAHHLRALHLSLDYSHHIRCSLSSTRLTLSGMTHIVRFTALTQLHIDMNEEKGEEEEDDEQLAEMDAEFDRGEGEMPDKDEWSHFISDVMPHALQPLQQLTSLKLPFCRDVTDDGIAHLTALTRLETLHLHDVRSITDAVWPHLAQMTSLREVTLGNSHHLTLDGVSQFCLLAAVTFTAARAVRVITSPHAVHPRPSVSLRVCCPRAAAAAAAELSFPLHADDCALTCGCECGEDTCPKRQQEQEEEEEGEEEDDE